MHPCITVLHIDMQPVLTALENITEAFLQASPTWQVKDGPTVHLESKSRVDMGQGLVTNHFLDMVQFCPGALEKLLADRHIAEKITDFDDGSLRAPSFMNTVQFAIAYFCPCASLLVGRA